MDLKSLVIHKLEKKPSGNAKLIKAKKETNDYICP